MGESAGADDVVVLLIFPAQKSYISTSYGSRVDPRTVGAGRARGAIRECQGRVGTKLREWLRVVAKTRPAQGRDWVTGAAVANEPWVTCWGRSVAARLPQLTAPIGSSRGGQSNGQGQQCPERQRDYLTFPHVPLPVAATPNLVMEQPSGGRRYCPALSLSVRI
jgi:hypothetical protein